MIKKILRNIIPKSILNNRHFVLEYLAARKYKHPSQELYVIGVTGTSGKSSVIYILRHVLEAAGFTVGSLSTIDFSIAGISHLNAQKMTMLGKGQAQKYLRDMVISGCDIAIVESTSEGRLQHRHRFVAYDSILLTNLYPEHIESHGGFINYKQAKLDIFEHVATRYHKEKQPNLPLPYGEKLAVVSGNSEYAHEFLRYPFSRRAIFGTSQHKLVKLGDHVSSYIAKNITLDKNGVSCDLREQHLNSALYGKYQATNIAAVVALARELKLPWSAIKKGLLSLKGIPGRIEFIPEAEKFDFKVIVDYAFEPVAIEALYDVTEIFIPRRIIHVTGSTGGGRDVANRFAKGELIGKRADIIIVTNEDPYDDDPMVIIDDVANAAVKVGKVDGENLFRIKDRQEAITKAIYLANSGDIVLVTGKGSEQAICIANGQMEPWDDKSAVREAIKNR